MFSRRKVRNGFGLTEVDPSMIDINERFIDACENGDYNTVKRILLAIKDFNIEITDNLGRSALRLAVENEHLEVVQILLTRSDNAKIREALLLSIFLGHSHIAELILKHPKYKILNDKKFLNGDSDSFWQTPSSDDAQFPPDITPLILAAQYNRTEIVQMLLLKGDRIVKPHDFDCKCNECHNRFKFDSLRHAQSRLNSYRGLASDSYLSLVSMDPILSAFELSHELKMLSMKEKFFKNEYMNLANSLSNYTVKLLNNVRGRDELDIVLNKTGKETEEKYERLARLDLAIKFKQKNFVAHPNCQQKLVEIWYTGLRRVSKMNNLIVALLFVLFVVLMPFLILVYIIAPKTKIGKFMCQPSIKFIGHSITYAVFVVLIIISSLQFAGEERQLPKFSYLFPNYAVNLTEYVSSNLTYKFFRNDFCLRPSFPNNIDIAITIWIIGLSWHEIKQLYQEGFRDYLRSINNIVDLFMIVLYIASFSLKYFTFFTVRYHIHRIESNDFWYRLTNLAPDDLQSQKDIFSTFYWLNEDRFYWITFDPINMAEALFALANILSISRICFLLPANQNLGPLQITLGKMIDDIFKFIVIFVIIFLAFMFAINNLYWYYSSGVRASVEIEMHADDQNNTNTQAGQSFSTIVLTFQTMFWSLFGLGSSSNVLLSPFRNGLTEFFGFLLYGFFHMGFIILLLNMLIAMMTKTYERILLDTDVEWKFSRSLLYMESIRKGTTLPIPFNIIPTPKAVFYIFRAVYLKLKKRPKLESNTNGLDNDRTSNVRNNKQPGKSVVGEELTYKIVMQRIVKRFLLHNQGDSENSYERDFEELKQDLQMIRYEMQNDLKRSKEESFHSFALLHSGIAILGEEMFQNSKNPMNINRFNEYKTCVNDYRDLFKDEFVYQGDADNAEANHEQPKAINPNEIVPLKTNILQKKRKNFRRNLTFYDVVNSAVNKNDSMDTISTSNPNVNTIRDKIESGSESTTGFRDTIVASNNSIDEAADQNDSASVIDDSNNEILNPNELSAKQNSKLYKENDSPKNSLKRQFSVEELDKIKPANDDQ